MGELIITDIPVGVTNRTKGTADAPLALAFRVANDLMDPLCRTGDTVLLDRSMPAKPGDDCIFARSLDGAQTTYSVIIRRMIGQTDTTWRVRQFNPAKDATLQKSEWPMAWKFLGKESG